jgi:hypothetical protein
VKLKKRLLKILNKRRKHTRLTGRNFLQYKIIFAEIGGKRRKLKGIYVKKKRKKTAITIKKATRKRKSAEINIKVILAYLQSKKSRFHYLSFSSDEETNDKIIKIFDEASNNNEFFEEFIDIVNYDYLSGFNKVYEFDDEADIKIKEGNTEIIELPALSRRNVRERKATRKSLNYYKKMKKGH